MPTTPVPPLERRAHSVSVSLAAHLERLIALGDLPAGARLPGERELARSLEVSRASLRQAMSELENKHLVERTPGRGTVVLEPSATRRELQQLVGGDSEREHVAELRLAVEPSIAALAARRATPANLLQLNDVLRASAGPLTAARSLELDRQYHLLLAHAAQNPLLTDLHALMGEWTLAVRSHSHSSSAGRTQSLRGHNAIYRAVCAQDEEAARQAMVEHLTVVHEFAVTSTRT